MAYRFKRKESIPKGVRRIAGEQLEKAISELRSADPDFHEAIHSARKRFKKIRALVRIVRDESKELFENENTFFRDEGRELSTVRDAEALVESFDRLFGSGEEDPRYWNFIWFRESLLKRRDMIADKISDIDEEVRIVVRNLEGARDRISDWPLKKRSFDHLASGIKRTYKRGRDAFDTVCETSRPEDFHELRKRVKYHWLHMRLLRSIWPDLMKGYISTMKDLSDIYGYYHDLVILGQTINDEPMLLEGNEGSAQLLHERIEAEKCYLQKQGSKICRVVYAPSPSKVVTLLGSYWKGFRN